MRTTHSKPLSVIFAIAAIAWTAIGCTSVKYSGSPEATANSNALGMHAMQAASPPPVVEGSAGGDGFVEANSPLQAGRQMVYSARFQVATANTEDAVRRLTSTVTSMGGYFESRENARVVCRIPADRFGEMIELIPTWGSILSQSIKNQDVTSDYRDLKLRIEAAEVSRRRVLALMDRAEKVEDVIKLEEELRKLTELVERLRGTSRALSEQIAYSTIEVLFKPPSVHAASGRVDVSSPFAWINRVGVEQVIDHFGSVNGEGPSLKSGAVALLPGGIAIQPPEGFLVVKHEQDELKAITPDESKLWIRQFDAPRRATLDFWTQALKKHLVDQRGYKLLDEQAIKDKQGVDGIQLLFEVASQGRPHQYLLGVYIIEGPFWSSVNSIRVVEFVSPKQTFGKYVTAVRNATGAGKTATTQR